jgi:predicted transcriptional regulator
MATLTIRIPDDKHSRLKELARSRGISINKLIEEFSTIAIAEHDAYSRFKALAATGDPERGLELLAVLDSLDNRKEREIQERSNEV